MAETTISGLPAAPSSQLTDVFPADQAGTTYKETLNQVLTLMSANIIKNNAGNPNGNVAGTIYNFCWDTTNLNLYVCTTTGNAASAVWTIVGENVNTNTVVVWVAPSTGSDTIGDGSSINPYATITHALSVITDNSSSKRYTIVLQGIASENAIAIKPFVSLFGFDVYASQIIVTGSPFNITLHSSWSSTSSPASSISNIYLNSGTGMNLNSSGVTSGNSVFDFKNMICGGNVTFTGKSDGGDNITLSNILCQSNFSPTDIELTTNRCTFNSATTYSCVNATAGGGIFWFSTTDLYQGTLTVQESNGNQIFLELNASDVRTSSAVTVSGGVAQVIYDDDSYPSKGFTFTSSGSAKSNISCPNFVPVTNVTAATYTIQSSDYIIAVNRAGAVTLTLPTTVVTNVFIIKDISGAAATNNITINTGVGSLIDGQSNYVLNRNYGSVTLCGNSPNWMIL